MPSFWATAMPSSLLSGLLSRSGMMTPRTRVGPTASTARCAVKVESIPPDNPTTKPSRWIVFSVLRKCSVMMLRIWVVSMLRGSLLRNATGHLEKGRHAGKVLFRKLGFGNAVVKAVFQDFDHLQQLQRIHARSQTPGHDGLAIDTALAKHIEEFFAKFIL